MYCMKCVTVLCIRVVSVVIKRSSYTLSGLVHTGNKGTTPLSQVVAYEKRTKTMENYE